MKNGIKSRLLRLEAAASEPPSPFDDMTADELRTWIPDEAGRLLICEDISEEHRAWLKRLQAAGAVDWTTLADVTMPRDLQSYCDLKRWE
jgi:hypothetical protein